MSNICMKSGIEGVQNKLSIQEWKSVQWGMMLQNSTTNFKGVVRSSKY